MNSKEILEFNTKRAELLEDLRKRKGVMTARGDSELRRGSSSTTEEKRLFSKFWDPDDHTTWLEFMDDTDLQRLYPPICRPLMNGLEIYRYPMFELYCMEMRRIDGPRSEDFNMILLTSHLTRYVPLVLYKRPPEEKIEDIIGRPLPLKLPARLPREQFLTIYVNNPINAGLDGRGLWYFCFDPLYNKQHGLKYDEPLSELCKDEETCSEIFVSYAIIQDAVKAMLVFRFIDRRQQDIQILSGTISAAHAHGGRNPGDTKRIVKHFPSPKQHAVVKTNKVLPVDRHVFGVPYGSKFQVTAEDLICTTTTLVGGGRGRRGGGGGGGEQGSHFTISGTLCFDVPTQTGSDQEFFTSTDSSRRLRLTVSWANPWH